MVCFVHDRQSLSQFHTAVNQLRRTDLFTTDTLRQLPKQCCSCLEKRKDIAGTEVEPLLTSLDFDAIRLVCIQLDLKQHISTNVSSSSSKILDYTILSFPISFQARQKTTAADQFIIWYHDQLFSFQQTYHVRLLFVTSDISEELLNGVVQCQNNLMGKSSNYLEAKQAAKGFWVIISAEDQAYIDIAKDVLQKKWERFRTNILWYSSCIADNEPQKPRPLLVPIDAWRSLKQSKIRLQKMLGEQAARGPEMRVFHTWKQSPSDLESESDDTDADLVENAVESSQARLRYLSNRFENSSKCKQPRTHRRQHILALGLVA